MPFYALCYPERITKESRSFSEGLPEELLSKYKVEDYCGKG